MIYILVWCFECCCVCHQGQICEKADLCLNLYPCVIKYYLILSCLQCCISIVSVYSLSKQGISRSVSGSGATQEANSLHERTAVLASMTTRANRRSSPTERWQSNTPTLIHTAPSGLKETSWRSTAKPEKSRPTTIIPMPSAVKHNYLPVCRPAVRQKGSSQHKSCWSLL